MSNILKMVQLDIALLKPYYKYFILIIIAPVITLTQKDILQCMVFPVIMLSMTAINTFSVAEKNDLNRLYGLLPVSKKDIVTGRYIFTALLGVLGIVISFGINLIKLIIMKAPITLDEGVLSIGVSIILFFLFTAIQLPGFFRFGAIKGKFFSFIPLFGLFLVSFIANSMSTVSVSKMDSLAMLNSSFGILIISILFAVVLYCISIGITQRIYDRMEL